MYVVVDERQLVTEGYTASFEREGIASLGLLSHDLPDWLSGATSSDIEAIQGFVLGEFPERINCAETIRKRSQAPMIALNEGRSLEQTLELLTASFDDVVRKPVHVREILARAQAVWRRVGRSLTVESDERLKVFFDGRDPEIDGEPLTLPRRERSILEHLVRARGRRVTKTQMFNAVYGIYTNDVEESVIEGHVSKLRKKLRQRLGYDPIEAKRYIGYTYLG